MKTVLVYGLKNVVGGIENYLMMMHKYLQNDLKFVFLVEEAKPFIYEDLITENGGEIVFLPERHSLKEYISRLKKLLRNYREETDTFYVNVGHISFDIIPITIALKEGYRVITHSHSAMQEPIKSTLYRIRQDVLRATANTILKYSNVERLAVSERSGKFLYKGRTYKIVSPGIEVEKFKYNQAVRDNIRNEYKLENSLVLGFVGRIVAVKNPLFLVDVLAATKQNFPDAKLLIVGDGALKNDIENKAKKMGLSQDVVFTGEVSNVQDYYQAMDILLAPSFSEGMPLGIMEAQSAGVPCICAKGNFPETIDVTGIVRFCSLNDGEKAWSEEVKDILNTSIDRAYMNIVVYNSDINIKNASIKLLEVLR